MPYLKHSHIHMPDFTIGKMYLTCKSQIASIPNFFFNELFKIQKNIVLTETALNLRWQNLLKWWFKGKITKNWLQKSSENKIATNSKLSWIFTSCHLPTHVLYGHHFCVPLRKLFSHVLFFLTNQRRPEEKNPPKLPSRTSHEELFIPR